LNGRPARGCAQAFSHRPSLATQASRFGAVGSDPTSSRDASQAISARHALSIDHKRNCVTDHNLHCVAARIIAAIPRCSAARHPAVMAA
jgi:hypothetical protein